MNITLIGMPGSGKSFIGERLAKEYGYSFADPDRLLEEKYGKPLQEVLELLGDEEFLRAEAAESLAALRASNTLVLAAGGSIVYSDEAMEEIARRSRILYLQASLECVRERIGTAPRGIVGLGKKTLEELYAERVPLYERYAAIIISAMDEPAAVLERAKTALNLS